MFFFYSRYLTIFHPHYRRTDFQLVLAGFNLFRRPWYNGVVLLAKNIVPKTLTWIILRKTQPNRAYAPPGCVKLAPRAIGTLKQRWGPSMTRSVFVAAALALAIALPAAPANAQSIRSLVSTMGSDNPTCSVASPCGEVGVSSATGIQSNSGTTVNAQNSVTQNFQSRIVLAASTSSQPIAMPWIIQIAIIGFVVGLVAKLLSPGANKPTGFLLTTGLGIAGALVATGVGRTFGWLDPDQASSLVGQTIGAVLVLLVWNRIVVYRGVRSPTGTDRQHRKR
jgi:uncharacterized membrane protein YeaQ/YmgE (transglycosylase-associated protein family)